MHHKSGEDTDSVHNEESFESGPIAVAHLKSYITTEQDQITAQYKVFIRSINNY